MTHERRKSDSVIVAEKPVNKADKLAVEQSAAEAAAAESAEPRAETKENAEQQSTCRTQGRESVSQALDCIRRCGGACTTHSRRWASGWGMSSRATSTTTQCRPTFAHCGHSVTKSSGAGGGLSAAAATRAISHGME